MKTPYTREVADVVPSVWLPSLLLPCPSVGWSIGQGQITAPMGDASSGNVALAHSVCIGLCWLPAVISIVGIPLLLLEQMYIAPVSTLNALDRDVRCGRALPGGAAQPPRALPTTKPGPLPPADPSETGERPERLLPSSSSSTRRDEPLPPPAGSRPAPPDVDGPRRAPMAF